MKRVYLAGPDVFYPDALQRAQKLKDLCRQFGFEGMSPLDNDLGDDGRCHSQQLAEKIRDANIDMIRRADGVIANLQSFRGFEPDSGTIFEVGFAMALGKQVICYAPDLKPMIQRINRYFNQSPAQPHDPHGLCIEDFGLSHNLMFARQVSATTAEQALKQLRQLWIVSEKLSVESVSNSF